MEDYLFEFDRDHEESLKRGFTEGIGPVGETFFALMFALSTFICCMVSTVTSTEPFMVLLIPLLLAGSYKLSKRLSPSLERRIEKWISTRTFEIAESDNTSSLNSLSYLLRIPMNFALVGLLVSFILFLTGILIRMNID